MKLATLTKKPLRLWRRLTRRDRSTLKNALAIGVILLGVIVIREMTPTMIDPATYRPLLNTIAKGESSGNYNAYFGSVDNNSIRFTNMTIAEVMQWQKEYVEQGSASNAVGRYQFMGTTLAGLVKQLRLDPRTPFNEALQDRLAIALIERRGAVAYVQNKITREQFATNLSQEWAALPRAAGDNPHESYYAGDGLNAARITTDEIFQAIEQLES